jgi:hypothetical protein
VANSPNPVRVAVDAAIERVERYGLPMTLENVSANVQVDSLTVAAAVDALRRQVKSMIPVRMKEMGFVITDAKTRERKDFWTATADELDEQTRIKQQSSDHDRVRIACDEAVVAFLREKEKDFGYEVWPGLFHAEIDRIYAMHGLVAPGAKAES